MSNPKPPTLVHGRTAGNVNVPVQVLPDGTLVTSSSGGGGGAVTVVDGGDVAQGSTTDAAVTGDNTGTLSGKLRGLDKILADVWDSINHLLNVKIQNATLGIAQDVVSLMSGSSPLTVLYAPVQAGLNGSNILVAAVGGKRIKVVSYVLIASGAVNAKFQTHTGPTDISGQLYLTTNTGVSAGFNPVGHFQTGVSDSLDLNLSTNVAVGGHIAYVTV